MSTEATLTSKGQTTIPKAICDSLAIQEGDRMTFRSQRQPRADKSLRRIRGVVPAVSQGWVDELLTMASGARKSMIDSDGGRRRNLESAHTKVGGRRDAVTRIIDCRAARRLSPVSAESSQESSARVFTMPVENITLRLPSAESMNKDALPAVAVGAGTP